MKLLIVDDEPLIRESLRKRLEKGQKHPAVRLFDEILDCGSAEEAIHLITTKKPALVITDVCMDGLTGLDVIKHWQDQADSPQFIVISGHADFQYAQEALNYGASGYLLKPITNESLFGAMERVAGKLEEARQQQAKQQSQTTLSLQYLMLKVQSTPFTTEEYEQILNSLELEPPCVFRLGCLHLSRYNRQNYSAPQQVFEDFWQRLQKDLPCRSVFFSHHSKQDSFFLFASDAHSGCLEHPLEDTLRRHMQRMHTLGNTITLGLSMTHPEIAPPLFSEASQALQNRFSYGNGNLYLPTPEENDALLKSFDWNALEHDLKYGNTREIEKALETLFSNCKRFVYNVDYLIHNLYVVLIRLGILVDEKRWRSFLDQKPWTHCEDQSEVIRMIMAEIHQVYSSSEIHKKDFIQEAKEFLEANLSSDLTLEQIARRFNRNPRYFSTSFKQREGITPMEYLTQLRICEAQRLLCQTDTAASDIGLALGYEDPRYFYKVFKKHTGCTPTAFRTRHQG